MSITKKGRIETGKECQIAHGIPKKDEDTKDYMKNLQILWWASFIFKDNFAWHILLQQCFLNFKIFNVSLQSVLPLMFFSEKFDLIQVFISVYLMSVFLSESFNKFCLWFLSNLNMMYLNMHFCCFVFWRFLSLRCAASYFRKF